jgi:hypothetical protein
LKKRSKKLLSVSPRQVMLAQEQKFFASFFQKRRPSFFNKVAARPPHPA